MTETQLDLRELALERTETASPKPARRRPWVTRYLVPAVIVTGFLTLMLAAAKEQFLPRRIVTVVPVVVTRADVQQEGSPLFQAPGWIEPRPTPISVSALTEGIIAELLVVEGQEVAVNEPVARLIDVDAKLALRQAEAARDLRQAELESAYAELNAAKIRVDHPAHLDALVAEAQSQLTKIETEKAQVPFLIESAKARVEFARQNLEGKIAAKDSIAGRLIQQAESDFAMASAELDELKQRGSRLEKQIESLQKKSEAHASQRRLLVDENRHFGEAQAKLKASQARLQQAQLLVEKAELVLERTTVRAPRSGRVLNLLSGPGTRVMGLETNAGQSSSTVVTLYDPQLLQVRADVRLEDVSLVTPGQPVKIETAASREPLTGKVLLPTSSANVQKNTLEVKIAINAPPAAIRPEMLVTATFLASPQQDDSTDEPSQPERLLVPRQLVQSTDGSSSVWIVDANETAQLRPIKLGKAGTEELVEVVEGLHPTDKLISSGRDGLEPGSRITISGEDPIIGMKRP